MGGFRPFYKDGAPKVILGKPLRFFDAPAVPWSRFGDLARKPRIKFSPRDLGRAGWFWRSGLGGPPFLEDFFRYLYSRAVIVEWIVAGLPNAGCRNEQLHRVMPRVTDW